MGSTTASDVHGHPGNSQLLINKSDAARSELSKAAVSSPPPLPAKLSTPPASSPPDAAPVPPPSQAAADASSPTGSVTHPPSVPPPSLPAPPVQPPAPPSAAGELPVEQPDEVSLLREVLRQMPSWLVSTVVHLLLILLLATYTFVAPPSNQSDELAVVAERGTVEPMLEDLPKDPLEILPPQPLPDMASDSALLDPQPRTIDSSLTNALSVPQLDIALNQLGSGMPIEGDVLAGVGDSINDSLRQRLSATSRARAVATGGGTPASEEAVERALHWLSQHQNSDGSWNYDHRSAPKCKGRCKDPGHLGQTRVAATAMALLPFLGTGQTHREGKYKKNIERGLYFLVQSMRAQANGGSLWEPGGRMYGHGLASIVLCEAYGMTHDRMYHDPAQASINYIVFAQDPAGGGWRYQPMQAGDTSVVGWQVMALKSANMAYLKVPPDTIRKAGYFLDSVSIAEGDGAAYGYTSRGNGPATTAIGLLCRMYMGWEHDHRDLVRGVEAIGELGPSLEKTGPPRNNMYYNYYATQVLHHYGGYEWQRWNALMRDYLVHTQDTKGHEYGSWHFEGTDHGIAPGGRLYCTAMATMILEVYYRHMPLYTDLSTKDKFRN